MILSRRRYMGSKDNILPASSYIQNGLIAMFDGIENAGAGVHSSSATVWKDLVGNNDLTLYGTVKWQSNHFSFNNSRFEMEAANVSTGVFIEACFYRTGSGCLIHNDNSNCIFLESTNALLTIGSTNKQGFTLDYDTPHTLSADYVNWLLYQDGVVPSRGTSSRMTSYSGLTKFLVGCRCFSSESDRRNFINGNLYNLRIYNKVLTSDEIAHNYELDVQRFGLETT